MKYLSSFFYSLGKLANRFFNKIARILYTAPVTEQDEEWKKFYNAGGEQIRFNYTDLKNDSVIFDLGGYEGQWASDIYSRFRSKVYVFEVYTPYYNNIKERFSLNNDIMVYNFGLASKDDTVQIAIDGVSTSAFKKSGNMIEIRIKKASDFIRENNIHIIHLMKINIEGAEYELLEHLIARGITKKIKNLQIQFHDFVPDASVQMKSIREKLSITHYPTYKFDFIWDNWRLKE